MWEPRPSGQRGRARPERALRPGGAFSGKERPLHSRFLRAALFSALFSPAGRHLHGGRSVSEDHRLTPDPRAALPFPWARNLVVGGFSFS